MNEKLVSIFVIFCGFVLIASNAASKTALNTKREVSYVDATTGIELYSIKPASTKVSGKWVYPPHSTKVHTKDGKLLWEGSFYTGRNSKPFLSKDGRYLVLLGIEWHFRGLPPSRIGKTGKNRHKNNIIVRAFDSGKLIKEVRFKDLFGDPPLAPDNTIEIMEKFKKSRIPGRGMALEHLVTDFNVDWKNRMLNLTLNNGSKRNIKF